MSLEDALLGVPGMLFQHPGGHSDQQGAGSGWLGCCCPLLVRDESLCPAWLLPFQLATGMSVLQQLAGFGCKK